MAFDVLMRMNVYPTMGMGLARILVSTQREALSVPAK